MSIYPSPEILRPVLLKCTYFDGYPMGFHQKFAYRTVYDYEMEFYTKSDGGIEINGELISYQKGDVCIRKPGEWVCGIPPYSCIVLCLDFYGSCEKKAEYDWGTPQQEPPFFPLMEALPHRIPASDAEGIGGRVQELFRLNQSGLHHFSEQMKQQELLFALLRELSVYLERTLQKNAVPNKKILDAIRFLQKNFTENVDIGELISASGLSRTYFHKCFKEHTLTTPNRFLLALRLENAKNLLCITGIEISEIALACGYPDNVYFSSLFKRETGMTPTEYRRRMQG